MAQVATETDERIDALLDSLIKAWRNVPIVAREIDRRDLIDQIDYVEEWGAKLSVADRLEERALSPEQGARATRSCSAWRASTGRCSNDSG